MFQTHDYFRSSDWIIIAHNSYVMLKFVFFTLARGFKLALMYSININNEYKIRLGSGIQHFYKTVSYFERIHTVVVYSYGCKWFTGRRLLFIQTLPKAIINLRWNNNCLHEANFCTRLFHLRYQNFTKSKAWNRFQSYNFWCLIIVVLLVMRLHLRHML